MLSRLLHSREGAPQLQLSDETGSVQAVPVPTVALRLLLDALVQLGAGHGVSIVPIHAELTTQEAADMLNVSRPFLVQLLERGEMPFHKTGSHRRVRYQDLVAYKERFDAQRHKALDALAEDSQRLGLGYD